MAIRGKGAQPTDARPRVQAVVWLLLCGVLPVLAGCSSVPDTINPVSWWHNLQGGEIAKQRPPPPGQNQAYPNLATIPPKPAAPDQKALDAITQGLVADRAHAEYLAAATPLADPSSPSASPALFGMGTMPPPPPAGVATASATLPAAPGPSTAAMSGPAESGPPAGVAPPPKPAPRRPVQSAPLAPLAPSAATSGSATAAPAASAATRMASAAAAVPPSPTAASQEAAAAAPLPAIPPASPKLSGPGAPAVPPAVVASASPAVPRPMPVNAVTVEFVPGSATLPPGAAEVLKGVAAKRGTAVIAVTGYGEANSDDPTAQSAALSLGLSRAQAVEKVLTADGVPASAVRVGAEAAGRGASVRLVQ